MTHEVFISYSSKDKQIADAVCHYLEARLIRCWIAPRDVNHGFEWADVVVEAIENSKFVVLVFSANANESPIVKREILVAVNKEIVIIPFRIENVLPVKAMELFISVHHWLDAITPPIEKHIKRLVDSVECFLSANYEPTQKYDPIKEIEDIAEKWVALGCPYPMLEGINQQLQLFVRQPPEDIAVKSENALMMLLMAALHFGGEWSFWVKKNEGNHKVIQHLLAQLNIGYYRPRFRALFTLQCYPRDDVETVMSENANYISPAIKLIVEQYVFTQSVPEYLININGGPNADMARRAFVVLKEIERYWGKIDFSKSKTELPMF